MDYKISAKVFEEIAGAIDSLLRFGESHVTQGTRFRGGGDPDTAMRLGAAVFYIDALSKADHKGASRAIESLMLRTIALASQAGVSVSRSPFDALIGSGHKLTEESKTWARQQYRASLPQNSDRAEEGRRSRESEALRLEHQARVLRAEYADRMSTPERADDLERQAAALRA